MSSEQELIQQFYAAFQRRDHATMAAAYLPSATFTDPVFGTLEGWRIGAMWRMLCERATDLELTTDHLRAEGNRGSVTWQARYTFGATGRPVVNLIEATFIFEDGRIRNHVDSFDLYRWCRQALGVKGLLLGWTPLVQNAVRAQAARGLAQFIARHSLEPGAQQSTTP